MTTNATANGGLRMPAEWEPHERTLIAWPTRKELWGDELEMAKAEYAEVARTIANYEPVTMVANIGAASEARAALGDSIDVVELPIDDSWLRDSGPLIVRDQEGNRVGVDFSFNAWGEKYHPYDLDAQISEQLLRLLEIERVSVPFVFEGGAIAVDGEGTALVTEQCLLNENRNPGATKASVEETLGKYLGIEKTIWLGNGLVEDLDTDGHVDLIASFIEPGRVLLQILSDPRNPNFENCQDNLHRLLNATDARERLIEVVEFEPLAYPVIGGELIAASYMNFYFCNGALIVPLAGEESDSEAIDALSRVFADREVVGVETPTVAFGGGGIHCITQQVPAL